MRTESPSGATTFCFPCQNVSPTTRFGASGPSRWAGLSGKGRFLGAVNPRYRLPAGRAPRNQTDPADTRAGPLGKTVHHARGPRTRHRRCCATGYGPTDRRGAARAAGRAHRGQRWRHLRLRPLLHSRGATVHHRPIRVDHIAARTADDDGGDRPDRRGARCRRARRYDRAQEVDDPDRAGLRHFRAAGRGFGVDADAADSPAVDRCDYRRVGGRRPGVRRGIGTGRDARIVGGCLSTSNSHRHHLAATWPVTCLPTRTAGDGSSGWPPYSPYCCCRC